MKTERISSMPVPYRIMAVSADRKTIVAETNSGAIYAISAGKEELISLSNYHEKSASGEYLKITINEIKGWLKRLVCT